MWFNISSPCFHSSGKCKPPSSVTVSVPAPATEFPFKNSFFNGSNFQVFLVHQAMECSLCRGGYRADVNTAFNYKSNPERATLHCPPALSTKARPSYSSTPHCNAGNLWPFPRIISQVRQKASQWGWVKGMWRMLRLYSVCAGLLIMDRMLQYAEEVWHDTYSWVSFHMLVKLTLILIHTSTSPASFSSFSHLSPLILKAISTTLIPPGQ